MSKRGFTLIELLTAIVIIALLSGIGIISYQSFFKTAEQKYYDVVESNILLAGNDYFEDHRDKLPVGSGYGDVSILELISARYIDQVVDSNGKPCIEGSVYVYRENNKYKYEVCLTNCGNHTSQGRYCSTDKPNSKIVIESKTASDKEYDVLKSYNSQEYSMEDLIVSFEVSDKYNISKYKVANTDGSTPVDCPTSGGNYCSMTINKTGTYRVAAYDDDKLISTRYFSAKIAKGSPSFTVDGPEKYTIDKTSCDANTKTKKISFNIVKQTNEEYKSVMYQVKRYVENESPTLSDWKEPRGLLIEETLESGHYEIQIVVQNYSSQGEQAVNYEFDITYPITLEYEDGSPSETREVVKDQPYNYLSDHGKGDPIPSTKTLAGSDVNIRWYKNDSRVYPDVNTVVDDCSFTIVGKTSTPVPSDDITSLNYCKSENELKYTGNEITLTSEAPDHVTFTDNVAIAIGAHTVRAQVDYPNYIWSDGTITDKEIVCTISKGDNPIEITDNQSWETTYSSSAQNHEFTGATNAVGTVTYSIVSQTPGSYFSIPSNSTASLTMAGSTPKGSYTVVVRASATGNEYYNSGYKDISISVAIGVNANPMTVTSPQTWEPLFSSSAQNHEFTGATNAVGAVTYAIASQKNNDNEDVSYFSIPSNTAASIRMAENTPAGSYVVEVNATAAGNNDYAEKISKIVMNINVGLQKCDAPTNLAVSTSGVVTWTGSSNCSDATYQVKISNGSYENATSGVDKYSDITSYTGTVTVYVRAIPASSDFANSVDATTTVNVCSATVSKGAGISSVSGGQKYIEGEEITLSATASSGYTFANWSSGGSSVTTVNPYKTKACNIDYTATAKGNAYTVTYSDNLFAGTSQIKNGVTAVYTENGSYLTLNGTTAVKSYMPALWNYERRTINSGDKYKVTVKYVSGTLKRSDKSKNTRFVLELTKDGNRLSNRTTAPKSYVTAYLPTSGDESTTITVDSTRASANGLEFWLYDDEAGNTTFTDYKVQVIITKVHSRSATFGSAYGTLDTPTKTGYDFDGWYTDITGGSKVTNTSTYNTVGNQTLYARWTSHKLTVLHNGNGSDVTWCSSSATYDMDSSKYALRNSSRTLRSVGYGQYIHYSDGLHNYHNSSGVCFAKTGYTGKSGEEWYLSGDSSIKYDQTDATLTAIGVANDAGCNLQTTSSCQVTMKVNWTRVYPTLTVSSKSGSYNCYGGKVSYKIKSSVAGTFTISSSDTAYATVSPTSKTVSANEEFKVTITGKKAGGVTITNSFTPTDTAAYGSTSKKVTLTTGKWNATGGGSTGASCNTNGYASCKSDGTPVSFCCNNSGTCGAPGTIHNSKCTCAKAS